jgi:hypothetical protein
MTITASAAAIFGPPAPSAHFEFDLIRRDDGWGTLQLKKDGVVVEQQTNAGWDDALPWSAGSYYLTYGNTRFGEPKWDMSPNPADRVGIQLHLGNQTTGSNAVTGCVGATATFLEACYKDLYTTANLQLNTPIPFKLTADNGADYNLSVSSTISAAHLSADGTAKLTISLGGPGGADGVSKDIWFRLAIPTTHTPAGTAEYGVDYEIKPDSGDGAIATDPGRHDQIGRWDNGIYVKLPKLHQSITYSVHVASDFDKPTAQIADLTLNDYYIVRKNGVTEKYSDVVTDPGVLLNKASVNNVITIDSTDFLTTAHLSGGVEGLKKVYHVHKGDVVDFGFQAYTIPDSLSISDGTSEVGTGGLVSDFHSGNITAQSDRITVIVVGSDSGTAWDLDLTDEASIKPSSAGSATASVIPASAIAASAETISGASTPMQAAAAGAASLVPVTSFDLTVAAGATATSPLVNIAAGHTYFLLVKGREYTGSSQDLPSPHLKVFANTSTVPSLDVREAPSAHESGAFFTTTANDTARFAITSDLAGGAGHAKLELFDATAFTGSLLELSGPVSALEGDEPGRAVLNVSRFGDLSKSETFTFNIAPDATAPISAADLADPHLTRTVTFAPGQQLASIDLNPVADGLTEGTEGATISLDTSSLSAEAAANAALLGIPTSVHFNIDDPESFNIISRPTISGLNASADESDGVIRFAVQLSEPTPLDVSFAYTTVDGTAKAGAEYGAKTGVITFIAGEVSKTIDVPLIQDVGSDVAKSFALKLLDPFNGDLNGNAVVLTLTGTIADKGGPLPEIDIGTHGVAWPISGVGDFDGNGHSDVLWRSPSTGQVDEWVLYNGHWFRSQDLGATKPANWQLAGTGDFDGDGISDVLWRDISNSKVDEWHMKNGNWAGSIDLGATKGADWTLAGVGDFNGDGVSDVLWRKIDTSQVDQWQMKNGNWSRSIDLGATKGADWTLAGVGDFNGDGTTDVLWRNINTSQVDQWQMKNGNWSKSIDLGATKGADWQVAGIGDFNHDGTSDILWFNTSSGQEEYWAMKAGNWGGSKDLGTLNKSWQPSGIGDFNHDGASDALWLDPTTGHVHEQLWML